MTKGLCLNRRSPSCRSSTGSNTAQTELTRFLPCARFYFMVDILTSAATAEQGDA